MPASGNFQRPPCGGGPDDFIGLVRQRDAAGVESESGSEAGEARVEGARQAMLASLERMVGVRRPGNVGAAPQGCSGPGVGRRSAPSQPGGWREPVGIEPTRAGFSHAHRF
jgi:hypothetical protein